MFDPNLTNAVSDELQADQIFAEADAREEYQKWLDTLEAEEGAEW